MNKQQLLLSLKQKGFSKEILNAFSKIPRENFIPPQLKSKAYEDTALPIGKAQTISQPYTIAMMLSLLKLKPNQKVLEVGSGCGYVLALISEITKSKVYGIEIIKELAEKSKQNLEMFKTTSRDFHRIAIKKSLTGTGREVYKRMPQASDFVVGTIFPHQHPVRDREKSFEVYNKDGSEGLKEEAPFSRILISAACKKIPKTLLSQLKYNAILVAPVGEHEQSLVVVQKIKNKFIIKKKIPGFVFVKFV